MPFVFRNPLVSLLGLVESTPDFELEVGAEVIQCSFVKRLGKPALYQTPLNRKIMTVFDKCKNRRRLVSGANRRQMRNILNSQGPDSDHKIKTQFLTSKRLCQFPMKNSCPSLEVIVHLRGQR